MEFIMGCYNDESIIHNSQIMIETTHINHRVINQMPGRSIFHIVYLIEIAFFVGISLLNGYSLSITIKIPKVFSVVHGISIHMIPILAAITCYKFQPVISL